MINLDPPYRLDSADTSKTLVGWCTVNGESPAVTVKVENVPVPFILSRRPDVEKVFPDHKMIGLCVPVDFSEVYRNQAIDFDRKRFLVNVTVTSHDETRNFEYGVT